MSEPKRELTPAALYELFERHSQCVFAQSGKCPLLVFTQQMCWEINDFFNGKNLLTKRWISKKSRASGSKTASSNALSSDATNSLHFGNSSLRLYDLIGGCG